MESALEFRDRDLLFAAKVRLTISAALMVGAVMLWVALPSWWRLSAVVLMVLGIGNTILAVVGLDRLRCRLIASYELADALRMGNDADVEVAWLRLMFLSDPAIAGKGRRAVRHQPSPRELRRRDVHMHRRLIDASRFGHR